MRAILAALLLAACAAHADDHVTVKYHTGNSRSDRSVTITIDRPFDKSGKVIPEVYKRLEAINALETKGFAIFDAGYITISAEMDGRRLESSSCHTLFERNPGLVVKSTGATALGGASRKEALAAEPEHFMEFRRLWEEALAITMKDAMRPFPVQLAAEHAG